MLKGKDGVLLEYKPETRRVHFGYPIRDLPRDTTDWRRYNSFFSSEKAVTQWRLSHPMIKGITRDPITVASLVGLLNKYRLKEYYSPKIPIPKLLLQPGKYGLTRKLECRKIKLPDLFFIPTCQMFVQLRQKGYKNFFGISLW